MVATGLAALLLTAFTLTQPATPAAPAAPTVHLLRVPNSGIQPQAITDARGTLHLLYFSGDPKSGDLFYTSRPSGAPDFAQPVRVNSQPGSAVAIGNNRGGQMALGKDGRVHVAWNGSSSATPKAPRHPGMPADSPHNGLPMLYSRQSDSKDAFEPQRNLITASTALDGGGSIAADQAGHVYVVWHALPLPLPANATESARRVYVATSADDGRTFAAETPDSPANLGACGCCGLKALALPGGALGILFRAATDNTARDATLLLSTDHASTFTPTTVHPWRINTCPMSTASLAPLDSDRFVAAWETQGNVFFCTTAIAQSSTAPIPDPIAPPGNPRGRKFPALAINASQQTLLVWTQDMAWNQGGSVHWIAYDASMKPIPGSGGQAPGVPTWSLVAAVANPDGSFTVLY